MRLLIHYPLLFLLTLGIAQACVSPGCFAAKGPRQPLAKAQPSFAVEVVARDPRHPESVTLTPHGAQNDRPQACALPCRLQLSPGLATVTVLGPRPFAQSVELLAMPTTLTLQRRRFGMLVASWSLTGAAGLNLVVGLGLLAVSPVYTLALAINSLFFSIPAIGLRFAAGRDRITVEPQLRDPAPTRPEQAHLREAPLRVVARF